jgi:hypothetical protein
MDTWDSSDGESEVDADGSLDGEFEVDATAEEDSSDGESEVGTTAEENSSDNDSEVDETEEEEDSWDGESEVDDEEEPPLVDKAAAYLAAWAKEDAEEPDSESRSDLQAYQARLHRDSWNERYAAAGHYGSYETISKKTLLICSHYHALLNPS